MRRTIAIATAGLAGLLILLLALPAMATDDAGRALRIEITEAGKDRPTVKLNLPLSLVEMLIDIVEIDEGDMSIREGVIRPGDEKIDVRKMLALPPTEFVVIEDEDARVKIWLD